MNSKNSNRGESDSFSIVDALFYPYTAVRDWFADALTGDDGIRDPDGSAVSSVVAVLTLPFRLLFAFIVFMVQAWTISRKGRAFILGLPAVGIVFACSVLFYVTTHYYNRLTVGRTTGMYRKYARNEKSDPKDVLIFAEKLHHLKPEEEVEKYRVGLALDAAEQPLKAVSLMKSLGPEDSPGYVPAHLWLARKYQQSQLKREDESEFDELASRHLELVVEKDPSNLDAQVSLASQYQIRAMEAAKAGDQDGKIENLQKAEVALDNVINPMFNPIVSKRQMSIGQILQIPRLLSIKRELGSQAGAMEKFDNLFKEVLKISRNLPDELRLKIFVALRDSAISVKDYDRAVKTMQQAFQTFDDTSLKQAFVRSSAKVFLLKAQQFKDFDNREEFLQHISAICMSLNANPAEREAYRMMIDVIVKTKNSDQNMTWLKESMLDSPKLSLTHLLIGFNMIREGDIQDGKSHWKIAFRLEKIAQTILNNIIDIASSDKDGRVENMLDINLIALEMFDQPMLYQSLGMNYLRTGDTEEAVKNFELALELQPALIRSHYHLIQCQQTLGNSEKANFHQDKLNEYYAKLPPAQRELIKSRMESL